jgi:two-component system response regulator MprA
MSSERILVIEDEARIAQFVERGLIYEGYRVNVARDGQVGLAIARDNPPDLVILDWMLPGLDGLEVCKRLRAASDVPILMLTAKDDVTDRVTALDTGADDYLVKPFSVDELMARVRALFRRSTPTSRPEILRFTTRRRKRMRARARPASEHGSHPNPLSARCNSSSGCTCVKAGSR